MTSQGVSTVDMSRSSQGGMGLATPEAASGSDFLSFLASAEPAATTPTPDGLTDSGQSESTPGDAGEEEHSTEPSFPGLLMASAPVSIVPPAPLPAPIQGASENGGASSESGRSAEKPATPGSASTLPTSSSAPIGAPSQVQPSSRGVACRPVIPASPVESTVAESSAPQVRVIPDNPLAAMESEGASSTAADRLTSSIRSDVPSAVAGDDGSEGSSSELNRPPFLSLPPSAILSVRVVPASGSPSRGQADASPVLANETVESLVAHTAQVQAPMGTSAGSPVAPGISSFPEPNRAESAQVDSVPAEKSEGVPGKPLTGGSKSADHPQASAVENFKTSVNPAASELSPRPTGCSPEGGTPAAPPSKATMLAQHENKTAGAAGKNLPASAPVMSFEADAGDSAPRMPRVLSVEGRDPSIFAAYREGATVISEPVTSKIVSQPVSFEAVEKAQALIHEAAVRINKHEGAALEVTIKPDAGTELSLHIRFHAGQIEARAVCQRGDYAALQSDWPELQERLSRQGIKLSGLESAGQQAFTGFTGQNPGQRRSTPDMAAEIPVFTAPLNRNSKPTVQPSRRIPSGNAWETWA